MLKKQIFPFDIVFFEKNVSKCTFVKEDSKVTE